MNQEECRAPKQLVKGKFFVFLKAVSLQPGADRDHLYLGHSYGYNNLLLGWSHQPYEQVINAIQEMHPEISAKTLGKLLTRILVKLFNVSDDADDGAEAPVLDSIFPTLEPSAVNHEVKHLLEILKSYVKIWTVFVFVEGVELKDSTKLPLGDATLYQMGKGPLSQELGKLKESKRFHEMPKRVQEYSKHCRCYMMLDVEGESEFVNREAIRQAQTFINVLNLYTVLSSEIDSFRQRIGVLGQPASTRYSVLVKRTPSLTEQIDSPYYSFHMEAPPRIPYRIDSKMVRQWKKHGLETVLEIASSEEVTLGSVGSRIRKAISWYSRAMSANSVDEHFVGLVTALESLLVANEQVSIAQRLADVVSLLIGNDFQSRQNLRKTVKELYDLRCRIVHRGMPTSRESLFTLGQITVKTILAFVRREVPNSR